jgi:16S rRNA (guanine966-N2)-methyltransferase
MRIVSGKYRGKKLIPPINNDKIRPTTDMVKEAIFDVIQFKVASSVVLDLFCGTGALGIEAVSREAKYVVFNDIDKESLDLTKKNCNGIDGKYEFSLMSYDKFLNKANNSFDIILMDAPFKTDYAYNALKIIDDNLKILNKDAVIVWERAYSEDKNFELKNLKLVNQKKYGTIEVLYFMVGNL